MASWVLILTDLNVEWDMVCVMVRNEWVVGSGVRVCTHTCMHVHTNTHTHFLSSCWILRPPIHSHFVRWCLFRKQSAARTHPLQFGGKTETTSTEQQLWCQCTRHEKAGRPSARASFSFRCQCAFKVGLLIFTDILRKTRASSSSKKLPHRHQQLCSFQTHVWWAIVDHSLWSVAYRTSNDWIVFVIGVVTVAVEDYKEI